MATRVCPTCGSQYVASVRRCIDCDVMLVEEAREEEAPSADARAVEADGDLIAYELEGWGNQLKVTLRGMLEREGIPNVWEPAALLVPASFEDQVDELVATVEGGEAEELPADVAQIAFEVEVLSPDELADLDARLIADHIRHAWTEEGELLVAEDDEEAVAAIIDEVLDGEGEAGDDGLALHAALDALYVAVDKLMKDPADAKLVGRYVDAVDGLDGLGVPYGMSGNEWSALLGRVAELQALVAADAGGPEADDPDDEPEDDAEREDEGGDEAADGDDGVEDDSSDDGPTSRVERARNAAAELRGRLQDLV